MRWVFLLLIDRGYVDSVRVAEVSDWIIESVCRAAAPTVVLARLPEDLLKPTALDVN